MAEKAQIVVSGQDATATAFQSVQRRLDTLKAAVTGFAGGALFGAISQAVGGLAGALDRINPASVIQAADELNKLSQRTGIAVESLGALEFAGRLADVSTEELATGLKRLNVNIAAAARGERDQADGFKAIGVSVKDASGQVRSADAVLGDIADRFATYNDGANKVALANALGGKSFEKLIPLLNGGRQGLQDARIELEKLGGAIGPELARKSEIFNDNMTRLSVSASALKVAIAGGLIDTLVDFSNQAVEAAKSGHKLEFAFQQAINAITAGPGLLRDFAFGKALPADKLVESQKNIAELTGQVARLQDYLARNPNSAGTQKALDALIGKINAAKAAQGDLQAAATAAFRKGEKAGSDFSSAPPKKREAPALPKSGGAGDDGTALLRRQLEGRLKIIQDNLERERDLFQFSEQQLAEKFAHGEISITAFYDAKNRAQLDSLVVQQKAFTDEIALRKEFEAKFPKPQDKEDERNKITEALAKQSKAFRESGQAAQVAEQQRVRATEEFQRSLKDLDAQLAELSGDRFNAELLRNARALDDARKMLGKGGGDKAREESLERLLKLQAESNKLQDDYARLTERAQIAEETFLLEADRSGFSRLQAERGVLALREDSIRQLDELIAKSKALAEATNNPEEILRYERLKLARERAFDAKDPAMLRFRELVDETGRSLANSFDDAIADGRKFSDVLKAAEKDFVRMVSHNFLTTPLATSFSNFVKNQFGLGGTQAGGAGGGDLFSLIGRLFGTSGGGGTVTTGTGLEGLSAAALAAFWHGGGLVTAGGGNLRPVPVSVFAGAERYHRGGLAHDEVPAILRKREEVLRTDDPRHRDNWGTGARRPAVTNNNYFTLQQPASRETQSSIALKVYQATQRAQTRDS